MINIVHLQTLRVAITTESFADAGKVLGYTASAVSQQIGALERNTGMLLFERTARGVRPTAAAQYLVERSRTTLIALDELHRDVRMYTSGLDGYLRVGAFTTASTCIVPAALKAFRAFQPGVQIGLTEGQPDELLNGLLGGGLDLVLVYEYDLVPREWPVSLECYEIFCESLVLLLPATHDLAHRPGIHLQDLADESWITGREGSAAAIALERLCSGYGFVPRIECRSDNPAVIRSLVRAGLGVAVIPSLGHVTDRGVKSVRLQYARGYRKVLALVPRLAAGAFLPSLLDSLRLAAQDHRMTCSAPQGWCSMETAPQELNAPSVSDDRFQAV